MPKFMKRKMGPEEMMYGDMPKVPAAMSKSDISKFPEDAMYGPQEQMYQDRPKRRRFMASLLAGRRK